MKDIGLRDRLQHAYNAFTGRDIDRSHLGPSYSVRADRLALGWTADKSIISSLFNMIAIDVSATPIRHVDTAQNGTFVGVRRSALNDCLMLEPNIDQSGRAFIQDAVLSLFDEGVIAIVPVESDLDPRTNNSFDIKQLRVGRITQWFPEQVEVEVYNQARSTKERVILPKRTVAIIENPLYEVMNKPNSTLKRLSRKLSMLDLADEKTYTGKLDIIIQLPYVVKTEAMRQRAENRIQSIEDQLGKGGHGIAYTDGSEKITQLNRPAENNLLDQIKFLTAELMSRLGISEDVFKGTATEIVWTHYWNRAVEPVLSALADGMSKAFLTKTARTQGQAVQYIRDPFKNVPPSQIVTSLDTMLRDQVITPNEARTRIGLPPSPNEQADQLQNPNINPQMGDTSLDGEGDIPGPSGPDVQSVLSIPMSQVRGEG